MDNAIPISHAIMPVLEFLDDTPENESDRAVANLAVEPGWEILEGEIKQEIERLKGIRYEGEDMTAFGFKCLASEVCINKLEWIVSRVRNTERTIRETDESGV